MTKERGLIGKTLGHYEINSSLGAGGMGEVYRALDTNLRRDVAIKVLPEALAADTERLARLRREAHLLASVNHPNIAAIYDFEESEGRRWLVLELVEGETLEEVLREGPVPVAETLRIGAQVAGALEAAHERGIVHRDLKSANVMIDAKGRVKVLDFGIAKDISGDRPIADAAAADTALGSEVINSLSAHLTATGMIVGTAPYMSPEQIRGHKADKRVDNWAFGCLMFELLTGRRPFDRETIADTLSAILEHEPDWDLLPTDTPEGMEALIRRCLQKDAGTRLHDIADARVEISDIEATATGPTFPERRRRSQPSASWLSRAGLQVSVALIATVLVVLGGWWGVSRLGGGTGAAVEVAAADVLPVNAVAVLPFVNRSLEPVQAAFYADGLAITVLNALQGVDGLTVPAWTSTSTFRDSDEDFATIGRDLGVSKILSGTVRLAGTRLAVTVELTEVASGLRLWTTEDDWPVDDLEGIFEFQDQVAREVAAALDLELGGEGGLRPTRNLEAFNAYLSGLEAYPRRDLQALYAARNFFGRAVELDPDFALAHAWLATMHRMLGDYTGFREERDEAMKAAEASARTALASDPSVGRAWGVMGLVNRRKRDANWEDAFKKALELGPNDSLAHQIYGWELALTGGRADEAWRLTERASELDPRMAAPRENLVYLSAETGDFDQAVEYGRQAVDLEPQYVLGHMALGMALHYSGSLEGLEGFREARRLNPTDVRHTWNLARALIDSGRGDETVVLVEAWSRVNPGDARAFQLLGDVYRTGGLLNDAANMYQAFYDASPRLPDKVAARVALGLLDLDRGDEGAAAEQLDFLEANAPRHPLKRILRLNLDMYASRYPEETTAAWRHLGDARLFGAYTGANWKLYVNNQPLDPIGYFGVLAGDPEASLRVFQTSFPELLGDDPRVYAFTLKGAIDLALVHQRMGNEELGNQLLERAAAFIESLDEPLRRNQYRLAPTEIYALQGHTDDALDAMQQAIDAGFLSGWWRLETKPHFDSIRDEPRFREMVEGLRQRAAR